MGESQQQRRSMNRYTVAATGLGDENGHPVDHREPPAQTTRVAGKQACRPEPFAGEHLATPDGARHRHSGTVDQLANGVPLQAAAVKHLLVYARIETLGGERADSPSTVPRALKCKRPRRVPGASRC